MTRSIKTTLTAGAAAAALLAIPAGAHANTLRVWTGVAGVPGVAVLAPVDCPDTSQFDGARVSDLVLIRSSNGDTQVDSLSVSVMCDKY